MVGLRDTLLFQDGKYIAWKYENFKFPLKITLLIYTIVHFVIGIIFLFNGVVPFEIVKIGMTFTSLVIISTSLKSSFLGRRETYLLLYLVIDMITIATMLSEVVSGNGTYRYGTTCATQLIGIILTGWFFPVFLVIPHVIVLFLSSEIARLAYNEPICLELYTMILPVAIGAIAFNFMLDSKVQDMYKLSIQVSKAVVTDQLTGAFNRNILKGNIVKDDKMVISGGAILLDIDDFKVINDTYGHSDGDICLCELVGVLNSVIRSGDFLVRWGGEEFLIICSSASREDICEISNRIMDDLHSFELSHPFTLSIGCTSFFEGERFENVVSRADSLIYKAKALGKNTVCS